MAPLITPFCFPIWAFPKLWRLVSEKNTCVGIPKGIDRGALNPFSKILEITFVFSF